MRLSIEHKQGKTFLSVHDNERVVASAADDSGPAAAKRLMQQVNRLVTQTKKLLVDAGLPTDLE